MFLTLVCLQYRVKIILIVLSNFKIIIKILKSFTLSSGYFGLAATEAAFNDDVKLPVTIPVIANPNNVHMIM